MAAKLKKDRRVFPHKINIFNKEKQVLGMRITIELSSISNQKGN